MAIAQNQKIVLTIKKTAPIASADGGRLADDLELIFYTEASPLYASVDYILLEGGSTIEGLPEAAIMLESYAASTLVDDILLFDVNEFFPDKTTETWKNFRRARTEFVKCKALAELYRAIIGSRATSAGRKTLADFTVDLGFNTNILSQARNYLGDAIECYRAWRNVLYSGGALDHSNLKAISAVKSGTNEFEQGGIGRGWIVGGRTLDSRENTYVDPVRGTKNRPRRASSKGVW